MAEELKPCPFCGGEAVVCGYPDELMVYVKCRECGACSGGCQPNEGLAADAWNCRAEHTCHVESSRTEWEDGEYSYLDVELSCGHAFTWDDDTPPDYCPYCGKRVVSE